MVGWHAERGGKIKKRDALRKDDEKIVGYKERIEASATEGARERNELRFA